MKITINSQILAQELRLLNHVVATKTPLPVLLNVLVQAKDNWLYFYATDLQIGLTTACPVLFEEPGTETIPVKRLLEIVENLPDTDVQLASGAGHITILADAFRSRLQTMPPDDFPAMPVPSDEWLPLSTGVLQGMITRVRYAISDKGSYTINGALLTLKDDVAAMVTTDGKRLAVAAGARRGELATSVIIPSKTLDALMSIFNESECAFSQTDNHMFFRSGIRTLISRKIDGQFPNYDRIIPRDNPKKATIDRIALAAALRRVGLVSEDNQATYLEFFPEWLDLTASSAGVGEAAERVALHFVGEPTRVRCSWRYVLDFLEAATSQTVTIELRDTASPLLLKDGENHLAVVMLMRG